MATRTPVVAGQFYPANKDKLRGQIESYASGGDASKVDAIGAVVPHAGYIYSGSVAASVICRLNCPETFIILGPNHRGIGAALAISKEDWATPLGTGSVDRGLVEALEGDVFIVDEGAHRFEHSIEVQLPFLQYFFDAAFVFVPICIGLQDEETAAHAGRKLAEAIHETGRRVTILASSDFTHYEPASVARKVDHTVIDAIIELDVDEMYSRIYKHNASVCGYGPIAIMLTAALEMGASKAELISYATSGDITHDDSSVVGYGGIIVT